MKKKKVNIDDLEEGKKYQVTLVTLKYRGFTGEVHNFGENSDKHKTIGLYDNEIDTIRGVEADNEKEDS